MANGFDLDLDRRSVGPDLGPDLGPKCLQRLQQKTKVAARQERVKPVLGVCGLLQVPFSISNFQRNHVCKYLFKRSIDVFTKVSISRTLSAFACGYKCLLKQLKMRWLFADL